VIMVMDDEKRSKCRKLQLYHLRISTALLKSSSQLQQHAGTSKASC
jgi:hypothetical protein